MWVEQAYKQTKYALGWGRYQVRSAAAIRRHWALVCCAFAFCWWHRPPAAAGDALPVAGNTADQPVADAATGRGENTPAPPAALLARGATRRARLARAVDLLAALLAGLVITAPATRRTRLA
jgi:hypothetical protein